LRHEAYHRAAFDTLGDIVSLRLSDRNLSLSFFGECLKRAKFLDDIEKMIIDEIME